MTGLPAREELDLGEAAAAVGAALETAGQKRPEAWAWAAACGLVEEKRLQKEAAEAQVAAAGQMAQVAAVVLVAWLVVLGAAVALLLPVEPSEEAQAVHALPGPSALVPLL